MQKIITSFWQCVFLGFIFVGFPIVAIYFNGYLNLPVVQNIYIQSIGMILCFFSTGIVTTLAAQHIQTGRSTWLPVVEKPKKLIAQGFYNNTRNPMYLVETVFFIGIACLFGHILLLGYTFLFFLATHILIVFVEEPELKKKFGASYAAYTKRVPRWILFK